MNNNISNGVTNFEQNLIAWGKSQNALPQNNSALKAKLLANLRVGDTAKHSFWLPKLTFATLALAALVLIVNLPKSQKGGISTSSFSAPAAMQKNTALDKADENTETLTQGLYNAPQSTRNQLAPEAINYKSQIAVGEPYGGAIPQRQTPPATDTRELVKTSYSAEIQSRNVQTQSQNIQVVIKGFNGRIDSFNSSKTYAYINFVLPQNKLDAFVQQIKASVGERFYVETMQGQNMLPQKQNIEQQQTDNQKQLDNLQNQKDALAKNHNSILSGLNSKLKANQKSIADIQITLNQNPGVSELVQQLVALQKEQTSIKNSISAENSRYNSELQNLDSQIEYQNQYKENLNKQTNDLLEDVNTVNGSIRIVHINFFEWLNAYVSLYWFLLGIVLMSLGLTYKYTKPSYPA